MRNNLWIFGDSFSFGAGMNDWEEYYIQYLKPNDISKKEFGVYLSEEMNLDFKQLSFGGLSNDAILRIIIENLHKFKKGDVVLIGITDEFRFEMMLPIHGKFEYKSFLVEEVIGKNMHEEKKIQSTLEDYIRYIHLEAIEYKNKSVSNQLISIKEHLNSIGITTYIWNYLTHDENRIGYTIDMNEIERITQATNNNIIDTHPSYKGHKQLSKQFLKMIKRIEPPLNV